MRPELAAKRYGRALFEAAKAKNALQEIYANYQELLNRFTQHPDFLRRFQSPAFSKEVKKFLLKDLQGDAFHRLATRFFILLVERKREKLLMKIFAVYEQLLDQAEGRLRAQVESARPLTEAERSDLQKSLAQHFQKEISMTEKPDPKLFAGFQIRIGNKILKNSAQSRLAQLKQALTHGERSV